MKLVQRYVSKTVFGATLVVLLAVCSLQILINLVDEVDSMNDGYRFFDVLQYIAMMIPRTLDLSIPYAVLIGVLFGLGQLASSSELTVMRAAGISVRRLGWYAMSGALVVIVAGMFVAEFVASPLELKADAQRDMKRHGDSTFSLDKSSGGFWSREGNEFFHVGTVGPDGIIYGVARFILDENNKLVETTFSDSARYDGDHWVLSNTVEATIETSKMTQQSFETVRWPTTISPRVMQIIAADEEDLTIRDLWYYSSYLDSQNLDSSSYELALWEKLLQPLASLSLVFIAISFVFGPLRQVTMGFRIFIGVIVGIIFSTVQHILGPISLVYGLTPILAVSLPVFVCLGIGLLLLKRAK